MESTARDTTRTHLWQNTGRAWSPRQSHERNAVEMICGYCGTSAMFAGHLPAPLQDELCPQHPCTGQEHDYQEAEVYLGRVTREVRCAVCHQNPPQEDESRPE